MQNPRNMAIFGTSTGGGMTLAMILRANRKACRCRRRSRPARPGRT